ncbi:hypothetical protein [Variovorax sp. AFSI2.2]|uniref:hypothetical protein n=1 Tax=Variovorax sp. AFSI2.2 TaxID=3384160 RepID=UPI003EBCF98D
MDLHSRARLEGGTLDEEVIERRELDLTIDYRLGIEFPKERREQLWRVQRQVEKRRLKFLVGRIAGKLAPSWLYGQTNWLARFVISEYGRILTPRELAAYFGDEQTNGSPKPPK